MAGKDLALEASGRLVAVSSPQKLLFPKSGITKGDLARYYQRIGETALPYCRARPLSMHRFPDGIHKDGFFHKQIPDYFPDWIARAELEKESGVITHVVANDVATLVFLADQACITPHVGLSRVDKIHYPDRLVFDLDPPDDDFTPVRDAAFALRDLLDTLKLPNYVKTTGSRGLHVEVPLDRSADFDESRAFARAAAEHLVETAPDRWTIAQRKDQRKGRVFIDYLRNAYGQTTVAAYGVRAREGAPIATPVGWDELAKGEIGPRRYSIKNIFRRLGQKPNPWSGMADRAAAIAPAMQRLKSL